MTTQTANYLDAIAHLPAGGSLILNDVPWEEYEELLSDLGEGYAVRIAYDRGRLEVMSPTARHEMYKDLLLRLVDSLPKPTRTWFSKPAVRRPSKRNSSCREPSLTHVFM